MCGLSGTFGDVSTPEEKAFKTLLIYSQIRGTDATGIGSVGRSKTNNGNREMRLAKDIGPPYFLFDTKAFDKCFYGFNQVYLGHNRSKTTGDSSRKCAHPFMFDDVIGAHNGTIDFQNKNRMEKGSDFKTDSEAIIYNIQCHGIEDTIGRIEKTEAYALTWYDRRDNSMNFIRNDHRPLWYIYSKNRRTLFYASEYEILMAGVGREEYRIQITEKPYHVTPDVHYKWIIPDSSMDELPEPERKKLENFKRIPYVSSVWKSDQKKAEEGKSTNTMYNSGYSDWEREEWGYEGGYFPYEETKKEEKSESSQGILDTIARGIDKLILAGDKQEGLTTKITETKVMTAEDVIRRQKYDKVKADNGLDKPEQFPLKYKSPTMIVHLDKSSKNWHTFRWNSSNGEWGRFVSANPPGDMPYTILDIEARHQFKHEGKGKNKKIWYKGFRGSLIGQDQFNKFMQRGCLQCDRKPEWGNEVVFLDEEHTFLCEWCREIPNLVDDLIQKNKKVG